jgi:hypothetical protein
MDMRAVARSVVDAVRRDALAGRRAPINADIAAALGVGPSVVTRALNMAVRDGLLLVYGHNRTRSMAAPDGSWATARHASLAADAAPRTGHTKAGSYKPKPASRARATRTCLMCREPFESDGPGHRRCRRCAARVTQNPDWSDDGPFRLAVRRARV